jgi:hypothetical protein
MAKTLGNEFPSKDLISFFNALAMASAGKICPPVPPPAMIIRLGNLKYWII